MATVQEILKAAGIGDEIAAGLPKEVVTALTGYVSEADTKLTAAQQAEVQAAELRRQAELDKKEVTDYVANYGSKLTDTASLQAKYDATVTYLKSLKDQGFDVAIPEVSPNPGVKPAVPGSPAIGANAVDENAILGKVGSVMSQWLDANNEHIRLYGTPIPEASTNLADEARNARKPIGQYIAEKYKFKDKQTERQQADFQKRVDDQVNAKLAEEKRKLAEAGGSNPNLRPGEPSRASLVTKIKSEDFHKSDGNVPARERNRRMLDRIHADIQQTA
jgi:hypothetical protein